MQILTGIGNTKRFPYQQNQSGSFKSLLGAARASEIPKCKGPDC